MANSKFKASQNAHLRLMSKHGKKRAVPTSRRLSSYHNEVYELQETEGAIIPRSKRKKIYKEILGPYAK